MIYINHKLYKYKIVDDGIISSTITDNLYVEGIRQHKYLTAVHLKGPHDIYCVKLQNGLEISCSDTHLFYDPGMNIIECKNIKKWQWLITKKGASKVIEITKLRKSEFTFDVSVASSEFSYFSSDILSHNSITSAIFITWYLLNHFDRNVVCTSATWDKVKELIDKIDIILLNLPFYMKLGIDVDNISMKSFDNGCKLMGETATENSGAGTTAHLFYADEFALIDPSIINNFFKVIFPTLSSSKISRMIITSTARGMNKFYDIYNGAVNGTNYFNPIRVDWWDIPGRDEEWKRKEIMNMGSESDFNQEYANSFSSGSQLLFSSSLLKKIKRYETRYKNKQLVKFFEE